MRIITVMLIALILSGCIIDTSASNPVQIDEVFQLNEDEMYIDIRNKSINGILFGQIYTIYTTSHQTAYLLSGASQLTAKLNDVTVGQIIFTIGESIETQTDTIYELYVSFDLLLSYEAKEKLASEAITSFSITYKNQDVLTYEHSPVYVTKYEDRFELIGGYKENAEDASSLGLVNNSLQDLQIQNLWIEGTDGQRLTIEEQRKEFNRGDTLKLPLIRREIVEQHNIEGVIGIYATLEDGQEFYLTQAPFTIDRYKEKRIEQLIATIDAKK